MNLRGFTLVELSIVLVIIAMIVGAIFLGQNLIHASRIQNIVSEVNDIKTAISAFKLGYDALPGDFKLATTYWSDALNGDGDGYFNTLMGGLQAWGQLTRAEIYGGFTGNTIGSKLVANKNVPASRIDGGAYYPILANGLFQIYTKNYILLGSLATAPTVSLPSGGLLIAEDAQIIDKKMDDNFPGTGKVLVAPGDNFNAGDCVTKSAADALPVAYVTSDRNGKCILYFNVD